MGNRPRPGKLVVLQKPHVHSRPHPHQLTQRLLLQERILAEEIRVLSSERKKIREQIRQALGHGAKCERGLRSAAIVTRDVLLVR